MSTCQALRTGRWSTTTKTIANPRSQSTARSREPADAVAAPVEEGLVLLAGPG